MVGEIRDRETVAVAIQAALTGHLVLATDHTNTAVGALPCLVDMGAESYLVASTVRAALAQRLVRRLCPDCSAPAPLDMALAHAIGMPCSEPVQVRRPVGCAICGGTGFKGRVAISEFMKLSQPVRDRLLGGDDEYSLAKVSAEDGTYTLRGASDLRQLQA
jgi:general secretion pathway protein E